MLLAAGEGGANAASRVGRSWGRGSAEGRLGPFGQESPDQGPELKSRPGRGGLPDSVLSLLFQSTIQDAAQSKGPHTRYTLLYKCAAY